MICCYHLKFYNSGVPYVKIIMHIAVVKIWKTGVMLSCQFLPGVVFSKIVMSFCNQFILLIKVITISRFVLFSLQSVSVLGLGKYMQLWFYIYLKIFISYLLIHIYLHISYKDILWSFIHLENEGLWPAVIWSITSFYVLYRRTQHLFQFKCI